MTCKKCGKQLPDNAAFCPECFAPVTNDENNVKHEETVYEAPKLENNFKDGNTQPTSNNPSQQYQQPSIQPATQPIYQPNRPEYNVQPNNYVQAPPNEDKKSIGLNLLSWFVPLAGIILYFINRKEKPIRSKSNLKIAIVSIIVNTLIGVIATVLLVVGGMKLATSVPGARVTINGEDYVVSEDGELVSLEEGKYSLGHEFDSEGYTTVQDVIGSDNSDETKNTSSASSAVHTGSIKDYKTVVINGKTKTLPMSYDEFKSLSGCELDRPQDATITLAPGEYEIVGMRDSSDRHSLLSVYIYNDTNSDQVITSCKVSGISLYRVLSIYNPYDIVLVGYKQGDKATVEDIKKALGEPDDIYEYESDANDYATTTLTYYENYDEYNLENEVEIVIDTVNNVITEITVEALH